MKCNSCDHKEVCGKKEAYKEAFDKLNKDVGEFEVELKCRHYKMILANTLSQYGKQQGITDVPVWAKPYIGDIIPNPYEITCK